MSRFRKYQAGDEKAFHPNLRGSVFKAVLWSSKTPLEDFEYIFGIYKTGATIDEKLSALGAIGATNSLEVVNRILSIVTEQVKLQDMFYPIMALATISPLKAQVLPILWKWVTTNWKMLHERLSPTLSLLGRVLQFCISQNIGLEFAETVEAWARGDGLPEVEKLKRIEEVKDAKRPLDQSLEAVRGATAWFLRGDGVDAWLESN